MKCFRVRCGRRAIFSYQSDREHGAEHGATAVEYALMVGLVAIGIIVSTTTLKTKIVKTQTVVAGQMDFRCGDLDDNGTIADSVDRDYAWNWRNLTINDAPFVNDPVAFKRADVDPNGVLDAGDRSMLWNARNGDMSYLRCTR